MEAQSSWMEQTIHESRKSGDNEDVSYKESGAVMKARLAIFHECLTM